MKKLLPDIIAILAFVVISFVYFFPADIEGRILFQHDSAAGAGAGAAGAACGAAVGAGAAAAFSAFIFASNTLMYLNMLISQLMKIRTTNTTPIPIKVFIPAFAIFSPVV